MKELDYYCSALFEQSNRIYYVWYILLTVTISCLLYSIFARGYSLYATTIAALLTQVISWYLKVKIENIRYLANEFQKISMLYRAYGRIPSDFQLSHLKAMVDKKISLHVKKKKESDEAGTEYSINQIDSPREILMYMIHENSYWNHYLYKNVFILLVSGIFIISLALAVTSFLAFPLLKIDPDYTVPRLAFTFLSFFLVYEILEKAKSSYNASRIMLEIDNEITRFKKGISEEHLLKLFNQYCNIKESAPDIPHYIYESNRTRLNDGWSSRIHMNDWAGEIGNGKNNGEN